MGSPAPSTEMFRMVRGFWVSRALFAAARLGLADQLEHGPRTAEELAHATCTHAPSLYRLLRALADAEVFEEDAQRRFALTPLGEVLRTEAPDSLRYYVISEMGMAHYQAWEHVLHGVSTGRVAFEHRFGIPSCEFLASDPESATIFHRALAGITEVTERRILESCDFSRFGTIVDVGGGHGRLLGSILAAHPHVRGVLYELPHITADAWQHLEAQGLGDRCELVAGDFFQKVPAGGDAYLLKWVLHDSDDARALAILHNCRRSIADGGTLLVCEAVVPPAGRPSPARWIDLNTMVMSGGKERTEQEFRDLLRAAGFRLVDVRETGSLLHVLEAVPVPDGNSSA